MIGNCPLSGCYCDLLWFCGWG